MTRAELAREWWLEVEGVTDPVVAASWFCHDLRAPATAARSHASNVEEWLAEVSFRPRRERDLGPAWPRSTAARLAFVPVSDAP